MNSIVTACAAGAFALASVTSVSAAGVFANSVEGVTSTGKEIGCTEPAANDNIADICNVLGEPDANGTIGQSIADKLIFDFGDMQYNQATLYGFGDVFSDYTFVFKSMSKTASVVAAASEAVNGRFTVEAKVMELFDALEINTSDSGAGGAANVPLIDAISFSIVEDDLAVMPIPASAGFLLAGLAAFGAFRMRRGR